MKHDVQHVTQEFLDLIKLPDLAGKKLNYLMVVPRHRNDGYAYTFPTGLAMISSALKASERSVFTLNLNYKDNYLDLLNDTIIKNNIHVLLCGGLSFQYAVVKEVFDAAKAAKRDLITVAGGGMITGDPAAAMEALENVDYGVIGEGEITINALAYALENGSDISEVQGVILKDGSRGKSAVEISNLDILPFPDYDGMEIKTLLEKEVFNVEKTMLPLEDSRASIIFTRSCPYQCTFCFHPLGSKYRRRSIDNIIEEVDYLVNKYNVKAFSFADEMLVFNDTHIRSLCEKISPYNITFFAQTRVDSLNKEKLQMLKDAGCALLGVGVESADNSILKSMKKNITIEQIEKAFDLAKELDMFISGSLIFGDPAENEQSIRNTINWRNKHADYLLTHSWIVCYPGSEDYKIACERGVIKDRVQFLKDGCPLVNISRLSDADYWKMVDKIKVYSALCNAGIYLDIDLINLDKLREKLDRLIDGGKAIAIWPATLHNMTLLNSISPQFVAYEKMVLVNINPSHTNVRAAEKYGRIYTPNILAEKKIDMVFCPSNNPVYPRVVQDIEETCKRDYPSVTRFVKLADLFT